VSNCPICETEYVEGKVNFCSTCGWSLTPYPLTFAGQIPKDFEDKEHANLNWSKKMWNQQFQLEQVIKLIQETLSKLESRLDGVEAYQQQIKSDIKQIKKIQEDISLDVEAHKEFIESLHEKIAKSRNISFKR
jgi:septal ring factor EnvC (AmiA/AmiB activator)